MFFKIILSPKVISFFNSFLLSLFIFFWIFFMAHEGNRKRTKFSSRLIFIEFRKKMRKNFFAKGKLGMGKSF